MTYVYKNLKHNEDSDNKYVITVEGVRTEQLGFIINEKGDEGSLTSVWGKTASGEKVSFYYAGKNEADIKRGETYRFKLVSNRKEPHDYREPGAERREFGVSRKFKPF